METSSRANGVSQFEMPYLKSVLIGLREAGSKVNTAAHQILPREARAGSWVQRVIQREIENRGRTRGADYWDELFPGLSPEARAQARIRRMLTRATAAGVAAAAGATTAELLPLVTKGVTTAAMIPLAVASVGAEMLYTTALQIDLAFDLAAIYGVPFSADDVGAISTLLAAALGVELVKEPTRHDKPAPSDETKRWRVLRQMRRNDFATHVGSALLQQAVARNAVPVASVVISAVWNQIVLRRFANHVHTAIRRRLFIVRTCRGIQLGGTRAARVILDGAWLIATVDGDASHQEALALATLIDSLSLPVRIAVQEASFPDDEEAWFAALSGLDPALHSTLVRVLVLVAGAGGELRTPERRFLRRLGRTLDYEIDFTAIDRFIALVREVGTAQHVVDFELVPSPS